MSVSYTRPEVSEQEKRWALIRDCLAGQDAVKAKRETYLPKPNASDPSPENEARYKAYLERAVFYNVTRRTLDGLVGQVFSRDPVVEIPDEMDVLAVDVDGAGVALDQQARKALSFVLSEGRAGLLADHPPTVGAVTKAEQERGYIRPTVTLYAPDAVINWRTVTVGARKLLSLVVIAETAIVHDDGFEVRSEDQYRVLRLVPPPAPEPEPEGYKPDFSLATYHVEIWRQTSEGGEFGMVAEYDPVDAAGAPLREIPFTFIGSLNNDESVDHPPLYDLAVLNIAHYRNSADREESCYLVGQPTPWVAGLSQPWVDENFKDGKVMLGSRAIIPLPEGGSAGLLQANPNQLPKEAMEDKERQMVALGAKLVEQRQVQRTAQEAGQDEASESSILATVAKNVSRAYTDALVWCAEFMGASFPEAAAPADDASGDGEAEAQEIAYALNSDFPAAKMTPDQLRFLVEAWQARGIAFSEMREGFRKAGVATLDDEAAKEEIDSEKDAGMGSFSAQMAAAEALAGAGGAGGMNGAGAGMGMEGAAA